MPIIADTPQLIRYPLKQLKNTYRWISEKSNFGGNSAIGTISEFEPETNKKIINYTKTKHFIHVKTIVTELFKYEYFE